MPSIPSTSAPFAGLGRLRAGGSEPMSSINVTPLVDVMLVLLVIFIITAPLLARSIRLDLPESAAAAPGDVPAAVHVAVNREGQVFLDSRPITLHPPSHLLPGRLAAHRFCGRHAPRCSGTIYG